MPDLRELYQETLLDHNRNPRNFREMAGCTHHAAGHNPLCGDRVTVYVKLEGDIVRDVSFMGSGCAISTASASILTQILKGKTKSEADALFKKLHDLVTGPPDAAPPDEEMESLGKLAVFAGVREYPMRVKCATLAWHTLNAALENKSDPVTTE